ncbi:MAG: cyclic nucleotide-binding domain-containing protein [Xanthobacteraceae bacterium]|nr:MAG: cyclic nucleotide-binding domain-containing protein [Xanthobacteraceae bacterium]
MARRGGASHGAAGAHGHRREAIGSLADSSRRLRKRVFNVLERAGSDRLSRIVNHGIAALIIVNLVAMTLESEPALHARYGPLFWVIELISLVLFTIEYFAVLWIAVEQPLLRHMAPWRARMRYVMSASGIVDLVAVLPFWIGFFTHLDLRVLLLFRILRFLKLTRYSVALRSLLDTLHAERRALFGCLVILMGATLFAATLMHVAEGDVQPDKFGTIPNAMWWAIVTLGTIGYGDAVPVTTLGKVIAAFTIIGGLVMVALPVGIIATAFAEHVHRRDFVITWGMIARVPLFAGFDATHIADIMQLLRAQSVEAGSVIARRGDEAHSMYFIASGEVEIELPDKQVRLGVGHFFGEIAVLRRSRRSATVTAVSRCDLLVLEARDLHALMEREPELAARVNEVMKTRLGTEIVGKAGDLITEEVESRDDVAL